MPKGAKKSPPQAVPFLPYLHEQLRDRNFAAIYLSECFSDSLEVFLCGLKNVVDAHGGVADVAKRATISREHLYRLLSKKGNPTLSSLAKVLASLDITVQFSSLELEKDAA